MDKPRFLTTLVIIILFIFSNTTLILGVNIQKTMQVSGLNQDIPEEIWNKTYGGTNLDWGWSVQQTSDNGLIIAGETVSYGAGGYDAWLIKTDNKGNELWNKTFGGTYKDGARSVQQTSDGGYIIGGYADSYGYPGHDVWLIKTDSDGNKEWHSIYGGVASDGAFTVRQTMDDGYVALGYTDSFGSNYHDVWLIKTDSYGTEEWNQTYGTPDWETGYSVEQTSDGGYIIVGTTESYGLGSQDAWLIKTDSYGNEEWNQTYGGFNNDWGSAVCITDDGGYIITGDTRSFGPGGYDIWLIKTDKTGIEKWRRVYGDSSSDDTGYSLKKTSDGGYIITGTKTSFSSELTDIWIIKTDVNGEMQWNLTFDGGDDDWSYSVDETVDGGFVVTGLTNSYGSGDYDLWLIKVGFEDNVNQPPTPPIISGPKNGKTGVEYNWTFVSTDPEGDNITYYIDWGDECGGAEWHGPYPSGVEVVVSHTYLFHYDFLILSLAADEHGKESNMSQYEVTMPKNKMIHNSFILRLLEFFPNIFQILRFFSKLYIF
jgi:hypothetical protein